MYRSITVYGPVYGQVYGLVYGPVYGPVYCPVYGPVYSQVYGQAYDQIYGQVYGPVFGPYLAGLCKNPGFSSKTQPSGFNWFKPGFNGFYGLNWGQLRFPLKIQNQRPKS